MFLENDESGEQKVSGKLAGLEQGLWEIRNRKQKFLGR